MSSKLNRVWTALGRRGCALLFFAFLDFVYAFSLWAPAEPSATLRWVAFVAPLKLWAVLWASVGLVCLIQAFRHNDKLAFACASALKVLWGVVAAIGAVVVHLPRGYVSAVLWLCLAGWIGIIATWPEARQERDTASWI